jgi:hypothetical protein
MCIDTRDTRSLIPETVDRLRRPAIWQSYRDLILRVYKLQQLKLLRVASSRTRPALVALPTRQRSLSYNGSRSTRGRAEAAHEAASAARPPVRPTRDTATLHSRRLHSTPLHIYSTVQSVHWSGLSLHPAPEARDARPHLHGRSRPRSRRLHIERSTAGTAALDPLPPGAQSCTCPSSTSSPPPLAFCP